MISFPLQAFACTVTLWDGALWDWAQRVAAQLVRQISER